MAWEAHGDASSGMIGRDAAGPSVKVQTEAARSVRDKATGCSADILALDSGDSVSLHAWRMDHTMDGPEPRFGWQLTG